MQLSRFGNQGIHKPETWGTPPGVLKKAEKTAKSAMTDRFVKQLQSYAQRDAKRGVYMSPECIQMQHAQMNEYVSPDRFGPMAQVSSALQAAAQEKAPLLELLDKLLNNCTAKIHSAPLGQTAEIFSADGESIAFYSSLNGGWSTIRTKAENKFLSGAAAVYRQAYCEARQKLAQPPEQPVSTSGTALDYHA